MTQVGCGLLAAFVLYWAGWIAWEMNLQVSLKPVVEPRYGFEVGSPIVRFGAESREVMAITAVTPGGPLDRAGLRARDIVVDPGTIGQLFRRLDEPAGTSVSITVVDGEDGPSLESRKRRILRLTAP